MSKKIPAPSGQHKTQDIWASLPRQSHTAWWTTPLKNDGVSSSVGMMTFPIWWDSHKIPWFQTTNQHIITECWPISTSGPRLIPRFQWCENARPCSSECLYLGFEPPISKNNALTRIIISKLLSIYWNVLGGFDSRENVGLSWKSYISQCGIIITKKQT